MTTSTAPFAGFCTHCEKLAHPLLKPREKTQLLIDYLHQFPKANTDFYPLYRLLLPQLDRERGNYGVRETALARIYAEAFALPASEAKRLRYYRDPSKALATGLQTTSSAALVRVGDFPTLVHAILQDRLPPQSTEDFDLAAINSILDKLAAATDT